MARTTDNPRLSLRLTLAIALTFVPRIARASTYAVYIPLDSSIYQELDTLNGLGYLDTYLDEIKPITRIEAARLTLEAEHNLRDSPRRDAIAVDLIGALHAALHEEIGWLLESREDLLPTMVHPVDRMELEYVYSGGTPRFWNTGASSGLHAKEGTPLLPDNDGIPTESGSNEIARCGGWAGLGGFLTLYGEGAIAGPFTRAIPDASRMRTLGAEAVVGWGNTAISFGQEEMRWGTGEFASLSQSDNAAPFPALRVQNIHPMILPGMLRYLGQFRYQLFLGQLDGQRAFAHPWIDGQILSFKPAPNFEFGMTHAIMFGGVNNDSYGALGFMGRATGFSTGNPAGANTNSRAGMYLKFRFPSLRNLVVYQEVLGEDNLTKEIPAVGRFLPLLAVSYQGGVYLPRLTEDGLTELRFEYAILDPNYSVHGDSLYWTYNGWLMGDPMGPNASVLRLQFGRWFRHLNKLSAGGFYSERAPTWGGHVSYPIVSYGSSLAREHSGGLSFDLLHVAAQTGPLRSMMTGVRLRGAFEYVDHLNFGPGSGVRGLLLISTALSPTWNSFTWN